MDEWRISKVGRYEKDFTPPQRYETDADTLALYHFDEGTGDVLKDSSGNNHHGQIVGAKWVQADGSALFEWNGPKFQKWAKEVAAMPAEKQLAAVSQKLIELNPGFDGKLVHSTNEHGEIVGLGFLTHVITNISPVRALPKLKTLACHGIGGTGILRDLTPLTGLKLTSLEVQGTQVSDLSPLRGMPLENLAVYDTPLFDLSPLADCKNLILLQIYATKVTAVEVARLQQALPKCKIAWDSANLATSDDPDRREAMYVLSVGGMVQINETPQEYTDVRELPKSRFRLTSIVINDVKQQVSAAGLIACRGCQHLTQLSISGVSLGDAGLEPFRQCKNLKTLALGRTNVTDAGLAYFSGCRDLTILWLYEDQVTDLGLVNFQDCKKLESLVLAHARVTDKVMGYFQGCQNLQSFSTSQTLLGDPALVQMKSFPKLDRLQFADTQVTNAGLASLPSLRNLTSLNLYGTQVDDAGVEQLKQLTKLTDLDLRQTKLTSAGLAELKTALPNCKIETDIKP
ncbi:MAG: leucine-rich repeat protein [Planctomycetia bacterium]|nr:leucine-rich repeat protein [Planctomycetia bacterium]